MNLIANKDENTTYLKVNASNDGLYRQATKKIANVTTYVSILPHQLRERDIP
jgi:hypothetical protein